MIQIPFVGTTAQDIAHNLLHTMAQTKWWLLATLSMIYSAIDNGQRLTTNQIIKKKYFNFYVILFVLFLMYERDDVKELN